MMVVHPFIWYYLWIAPYVLQLGVAWMLYRRGLHRELPAFIYFLVIGAIGTAILVASLHDRRVSDNQYLFLWAASVFAEAGLRIATIAQIYRQVFQSYPGLESLGRSLFRWVALSLMVVGIGMAMYAPPDGPHLLWNRFYMAQRTLLIIQCGLLLFLFVFAWYFGLSFRRHTLGIALGFGLTLSVNLAIAAIQSHLGTNWANLTNYFFMAVYHVTVLIWWYYLLVPQPGSVASRVISRSQLQQWNESLRRLLG
jgi:hypothetical protein